jgi:cytoskeletal protein CcmA (bactofilin family)
MQHAAHIGPSVLIKGEISAREHLCVAGRVEGRIDVEGYNVTIEPGAHVEADVTADGIIIAGTTHGALTAEHRIELRGTGVVEGDLRAASLSIEDGAFVRGKVEVTTARAVDLAEAS